MTESNGRPKWPEVLQEIRNEKVDTLNLIDAKMEAINGKFELIQSNINGLRDDLASACEVSGDNAQEIASLNAEVKTLKEAKDVKFQQKQFKLQNRKILWGFIGVLIPALIGLLASMIAIFKKGG